MQRRDFCRRITATAISVGALAMAKALPLAAEDDESGLGDVAQIYRLQAAFHRAKTTQNLDLMLSLWEPNATFEVLNDPKSPYVGIERLQEFWANSGSFKNRRFSLVPSFKTQIEVRGNNGTLYFECHDIADYGQPTRNIINDTFLRGTLHKVDGKWKFAHMTAGPSTPLSVDHYY